MANRFSYVQYDEMHCSTQENAKDVCEALEAIIDRLPMGRARSLALTRLEETYMWIGKAIRDDQLSTLVSPEGKAAN